MYLSTINKPFVIDTTFYLASAAEHMNQLPEIHNVTLHWRLRHDQSIIRMSLVSDKEIRTYYWCQGGSALYRV